MFKNSLGTRHAFPLGYPPSSFCRSCGRDFTSDTYFDLHRIGSHDKDTRSCMSDRQLRKKGFRPMTDEEKLAGRHKRRIGVPLWFSPERAQKLATAFQYSSRGVST